MANGRDGWGYLRLRPCTFFTKSISYSSAPCTNASKRRYGWRSLAHILLTALVIGLVVPGPVRAEDADTGVKEPPAKPKADDAGVEGEGEDGRTVDEAAFKRKFEEAEVALEECKFEAAANLYWEAIEANYKSYVAHVRYQAASLQAGGEGERANLKEDYDVLVKDFPKEASLKLHRLRLDPVEERLPKFKEFAKKSSNADVIVEYAVALLANGDTSDALKQYERAVALAPAGRTDIALAYAEALWKAEPKIGATKRKKAREQIGLLLAANAEDWKARLLLARLDLDEGEFKAAEKHAQTVLTLRPSFVAAFLVRAEAIVAQGKQKDALKSLDGATRIAPEARVVLLAVADITAKAEDEKAYKAATVLYKKVLAKNKEDVHALFGLAWVLEREKKFKEAMQNYKALTHILPDSPIMLNGLGFTLLKQGRVSEAQVQFRRAIDLDESYVDARLNLGATYDAQAKYGEAIKIYEKILREKEHAENMRAIVNCAFDYEAQGAFPKAAKLLERAHKLKPKDAKIMVWLGDNFYFQKKFKKAIDWYKKGIAQDPKSFFGWRGLGYSYAQTSKWEDAAKAIEEALKIKADEKDLRLALAYLYLDRLKDEETAMKHLKKYLAAGGDDPDAEDLLDELKENAEKKK